MESAISRFIAIRVETGGQGMSLPSYQPDSRCEYARAFEAWTEDVASRAIAQGEDVALNRAKLALVDKYFDWRASVPKSHRSHTNERGHRCIWHVFTDCYAKLRLAELALSPPLLSPRSPTRADASGIYIGGLDDDTDTA